MDKVNNIKDVVISPLKIISHPKGDIYHGIKNTDSSFSSFGEAYFSLINYNEIKAWKKHFKMTLNLIVPLGEVRFVLIDQRINSSTKGNFLDINISSKNYKRLTIPPNIWIGFKGISKTTNLILNVANIIHDPNEQVNKDLDSIKYQW
jgi:dTDP-4-dehydrorhamnose 3,5-epimerase